MYLLGTQLKIETLVIKIVSMQKKTQNFDLFVFMKFRPPPPLELRFLLNNDKIYKNLSINIFTRHLSIVLNRKDQHQELNNSVLGC